MIMVSSAYLMLKILTLLIFIPSSVFSKAFLNKASEYKLNKHGKVYILVGLLYVSITFFERELLILNRSDWCQYRFQQSDIFIT